MEAGFHLPVCQHAWRRVLVRRQAMEEEEEVKDLGGVMQVSERKGRGGDQHYNV